MNPFGRTRKIETGLAFFTLGALPVYGIGETAYSWPDLTNPGYIVDVIAFALLLLGGWHSLRHRPRPAVGPLCAAWGFCACLGWRTYFMRVYSRERGLGIYGPEHPAVEPILATVTVIAFSALVLGLYVAVASDASERRSGT